MKKRDSKFEIIRIISMIFITLCHISVYGNWTKNVRIIRFENMVFYPLGEVGVYLFVFISGYFLSVREVNFEKQLTRIKPLWIKTIFYSWIMLLLTLLFKFKSVGLKDIIVAIFPVSFNEYWFMTCFIILMFFLQPINNLINSVSQKELIEYIIVLVFFSAIIPVIKRDVAPIGGIMGAGILFTSYLISAYIRKYDIRIKNFYAILISLAGFLLEYVAMFLLKNKTIDKFNFGLFPLIASVGIFLLILNVKSFYSKIINWIATGVLASYLIINNPLFSKYYWCDLLNVGQYQNPTWKLIVMGILISVITVLICSIIDHVYQWGYKKIVNMHSAN